MNANHLKKSRRRLSGLIALMVAVLLPQAPLFGQIRSGGAFLQFTPGARHQGMAGALTGGIDEMHVLLNNPAATGFLREWQWATSYAEWFANTYNLSVLFGKEIQTPWSRRSRFALAIQYQGIREFDSTNELDAAASANDFLLTLSYGSPVSFLSRHLSAGVNVKYLRSKLADFSASSLVADVGLLYKSPRFRLKTPLFDYGILSAGVALTQMGKGLDFISETTPLPRTFQAGTALNLGRHDGFQVQVTADYKKTRNQKATFSLGTELSWSYKLALRGGYNFNDNLLSKLSFGLSFRLDGRSSGTTRSFPGTNNAMRVDVAAVESNQVFSQTYRATLNHYPIAPERFSFLEPLNGQNLNPGKTSFAWQASRDPDLYDDVGYVLLIEKLDFQTPDSLLLTNLLQKPNRKFSGFIGEIEHLASDDFFVYKIDPAAVSESDIVQREIDDLQPGKYFWTVLAYDRDQHVRLAEKAGRNLWNFTILPDLELTKLDFRPDSLITDSDYQGDLLLRVRNRGTAESDTSLLVIADSLQWASDLLADGFREETMATIPLKVAPLKPGQDTTIAVPWQTTLAGRHRLTAQLDARNSVPEFDETNNQITSSFFTIPKGRILTDSTVIATHEQVIAYELPFVPKVYFAHNSAELQDDLSQSSLLYSPLAILARRLEDCGDVQVRLQGFVDAASGEPPSLVFKRARSVKQRLIELGVPAAKIVIPKKISPQQLLTRRASAKDLDRIFVQQENRYVKISAFRKGQEDREVTGLFNPVFISIPKTRSMSPVLFISDVRGSVPLRNAHLLLQTDTGLADSLAIGYARSDPDTLIWQHFHASSSPWLNQRVRYSLALTDSLGRTFYTPGKSVALVPETHNELKSKVILGIAEFQSQKPDSTIYWSNILTKVKEQLGATKVDSLELIGHACVIGDVNFNQTLSQTRATFFYQKLRRQAPRLFHTFKNNAVKIRIEGRGEQDPYTFEVDRESFLSTIKQLNPRDYERIVHQIESGEKEDPNFPLTFQAAGDKLRISSDSRTPFGRQINRRIEILFDKSELLYNEYARKQ